MNRSIRFRLTAWYAVILSASLALFGGLIWFSLRQRLLSEVDQDLAGRASRFEEYFHIEAAETATDKLLGDELNEFCQALPPRSFVHLQSPTFAFTYGSAASDLRTLKRQFGSFQLEMGTSLGSLDHTLNLLRLLLLSLSPGVVLIACLGGAWLSGRALKPVIDITDAALNISIENLARRLPVPPTGDEIARLSNVLNTMLQRLEDAVKTLSQFVADASHEFRTPLTVIRTTAELALRRDREPEVYRQSLQQIEAEAVRMTELVEELLILARSDTGTAEMPLTALDLTDLLSDVLIEIQGLADSKRIRITMVDGHPATVLGNRAGLHRLFLALLDNAIKYSSENGEVIVSLEGNTFEVKDFGAGISTGDLPYIFKRFYQADRSRNNGGYGLGLSLAESIVKAHGGAIAVSSTPGVGSSFKVTLG